MMNRKSTHLIVAAIAIALVAAAAPFAAAQLADANDHDPPARAAANAAPGALGRLAVAPRELAGRTPRPPKPNPRHGGSSGSVWVAEADPTWQEQLRDFGDRLGELFPDPPRSTPRRDPRDIQRQREAGDCYQDVQRSDPSADAIDICYGAPARWRQG